MRVITYTIPMGNYSNSTTIYLLISYQKVFFWINNNTKVATAHHYGLFCNLQYASYLVTTYTIPMRNYLKL